MREIALKVFRLTMCSADSIVCAMSTALLQRASRSASSFFLARIAARRKIQMRTQRTSEAMPITEKRTMMIAI